MTIKSKSKLTPSKIPSATYYRIQKLNQYEHQLFQYDTATHQEIAVGKPDLLQLVYAKAQKLICNN